MESDRRPPTGMVAIELKILGTDEIPLQLDVSIGDILRPC